MKTLEKMKKKKMKIHLIQMFLILNSDDPWNYIHQNALYNAIRTLKRIISIMQWIIFTVAIWIYRVSSVIVG